jgi:hypothetical protein
MWALSKRAEKIIRKKYLSEFMFINICPDINIMLRDLCPVYFTKILMEGSADITTNTTFEVLCSHLPLDCVTYY